MSPNTFDEMVQDGRMPRPRRLSDRRKAWDVRSLDAAIDALPVDGEAPTIDDTWNDIDAAQAAAAR
ncbi:helix-turn-helix transcriptional regulator [Blastochloris tepida]|uniref:helix-turn-helix transcriptional regulator n=1 Tax=Blastochloris tepida TaxID=2233851 RepID=UPI001FCF2398|nr:hypothetical protein [Blastochloris tepida]